MHLILKEIHLSLLKRFYTNNTNGNGRFGVQLTMVGRQSQTEWHVDWSNNDSINENETSTIQVNLGRSLFKRCAPHLSKRELIEGYLSINEPRQIWFKDKSMPITTINADTLTEHGRELVGALKYRQTSSYEGKSGNSY